MRKFFSIMIVLALFTVATTCLFSKVKVGDSLKDIYESPHPYSGGHGLVYEKEFYWPRASYISIHFSGFDLPNGDYLEICSPDGQYSYIYTGKGKVIGNGEQIMSEFWASHIPGEKAHVRLYSKNPEGGFGFVIDEWAHGYEAGYVDALMSEFDHDFDASIEAICSADDKKWAKCYEGTTIYEKSKAVCRLLIGGTSACTGWLLGSEGHVMTNNHCISTQSDAGNTDYEFMAEGATCTTSCASWGACPGVVAATSGTLIKTDTPHDYALILLPVNVTSQYGYLQFRNSLPTVGERIYIPQHPSAYGKQIAVESDADGGYAKVYSLDEPACQTGGPNDIGYMADTIGGSSGSPVIAYSDNLVVALHHCATCPNRGVPIPNIITHLGSSLPANAIGGTVVNPPAAPSNLTATAAACNQVNLTWTDNSTDESQFVIERGTNGTTFTQIATVSANVVSYSDTTVAASTTYYYRVKASNSGGSSAYTNTANATTPACPPAPPTAPSNLKASPSKTSVSLTWTDNSTNETGFRIYRGSTSSNLTLIATVGANVTAYTNSGLSRRTTYYYKVCAYNANGESCSSVISTRTK